MLDRRLWASLVAQGAVVDARRGDDDDPLAGVVHVLLPDGTDVDVVVGRWAWERRLIERAERVVVAPGVDIPVPATSDLVLLKLAAGGFADLQDAAALLGAGNRAGLIVEVESRLAEVRPDVRATWQHLLEQTAE